MEWPSLCPFGATCQVGACSSRRLASLSRLAAGNEGRTKVKRCLVSRLSEERSGTAGVAIDHGAAVPWQLLSESEVNQRHQRPMESHRSKRVKAMRYPRAAIGRGDIREKPVDSSRARGQEEATPRGRCPLVDEASPVFAALLPRVLAGTTGSRSRIESLDSAGPNGYTNQCNGGQ